MIVSILGSADLDIKPEDMFRMVRGWVKPHRVTKIVTTDDSGVSATAREIAETHGIDLAIASNEREAIEWSEFTGIFRKSTEYDSQAKRCVERNRLFREFVFATDRSRP